MTSFFVLRKFPQRFRFHWHFCLCTISFRTYFFLVISFLFVSPSACPCAIILRYPCFQELILKVKHTHALHWQAAQVHWRVWSTYTISWHMVSLHLSLKRLFYVLGCPCCGARHKLVPNITDVDGKGLDALHCVLMPSYPTYRADRRIFRSIGWWACTYSILFFSSPPTAPSFPSAPPPWLTCAGSYNYRPNVLNIASMR